ncbi:hypothetical protein FRUB_01305 [Fimbriiglobus ruber]|uniref:Uncharacterized protein n=1 Tax=Fimbriiglobus ruber TaxID=1908690 RepID=A0A225DZH2_9BACT|nr:hypothetical protein FRUB_01305 [Fimbriiglobus ruber]
MFRRLWNDDQGAIITVEWILIVGLIIFGLIPGFIAVRNAGNATLATIGNILLEVIPNFTFSGFGIAGTGTGGAQATPLAQVGGAAYQSDVTRGFTSYEVAPTLLSTGVVGVKPVP